MPHCRKTRVSRKQRIPSNFGSADPQPALKRADHLREKQMRYQLGCRSEPFAPLPRRVGAPYTLCSFKKRVTERSVVGCSRCANGLASSGTKTGSDIEPGVSHARREHPVAVVDEE